MKILNISLLFLIFICFCSCVDNYYSNYTECPSCDNTSNTKDSSTTSNFSKVIFTAIVDEEITRASTTPLQTNRFAMIYTFVYKEDHVSTLNYTTQEAGVLSPISGTPLTLIDGEYEFYALSIGNQAEYPPTVTNFSTGFVSGLSNGIDYLSAQSVPEVISGNTSVALTFSHACTQLMVEIVSADATTIKINSIDSASITPPINTGNVLSLFTGVISPSSSISSTYLGMNISGDTCHQILLPLKYSSPLKMYFEVTINDETQSRSYTADIPLLNNTLSEGTSYLYEILLSENEVTFNNVTVKDWTEVNETGDPITPTGE